MVPRGRERECDSLSVKHRWEGCMLNSKGLQLNSSIIFYQKIDFQAPHWVKGIYQDCFQRYHQPVLVQSPQSLTQQALTDYSVSEAPARTGSSYCSHSTFFVSPAHILRHKNGTEPVFTLSTEVFCEGNRSCTACTCTKSCSINIVIHL